MADSVKIRITGEDKEFRDTLSGIGKTAGSVFKGMMSSQIVTKGLAMLVNGLKSAVTTGMEFEASMSQVAAISGATGEELQTLTDTARHYGETTKFTASEAAQALQYMALAGWDANQSTEALGGVLALAAASGMDLARASDAVTDYLSAFGMEASQAGYMADLMAYAQSNANTSASQLADAYGNCASSMHAAGQDIETTTAMLMALANQGIKGSEAGTQVSAVMRDLTQKMKNGSIQIGKTKVAVQDANGNFRDMNDIMADISKATEGMGTAEKSAALMKTFSARSIKAVNTLLNEGVDAVDSYEEALRKSGGTAEAQAKTMMDNLKGDIQVFKSALEGLQITAGESMNGSMRSVVQEMTGLMEKLTKAGKTGGLSGIVDAFIGQIPALLPKINAAASKLLSGIGKKLPGILKGIVGTIPDVLKSINDLTPELIGWVSEALSGVAEGVTATLPQILMPLVTGSGKALQSIGKGILNVVKGLFSGIRTILLDTGLIKGDLEDVIGKAFKNLDTSDITVPPVRISKVVITGEIDTTEYTQAIQNAVTEISTSVSDLGLKDEEKKKIEQAIINGSGAEAIELALTKLRVPAAKAKGVAAKIAAAGEVLNSALGGLGIDEETQAKVREFIAAGGTVEEALTTVAGLSADEAAEVAAKVQPALDEASAAIKGLKLKDADTTALYQSCLGTKEAIVGALTLLGASDEDIETALAAMEALSGNVSSRMETAYMNLIAAFTDKDKSNDTRAKEQATEAFEAYTEEVKAKIDAWAAEAKAELEKMDLTAEELASKAAEIDAEAESMKANLDNLNSDAAKWASDNAGQAVATVQAHKAELEGIVNEVDQIEARIETLRGKLNPAATALRVAVERGSISNKSLQLEAIELTAAERDDAILEATQKREEEVKRAREKFETANADAEKAYAEAEKKQDHGAMAAALEAKEAAVSELDAEIKAADDELTRAEKVANEQYDKHMENIAAGILMVDPKINAAVEQAKKDNQINKLWEAIISDEEGKAADLDTLLKDAGLDESSVQALADALGKDVDDVRAQLEGILAAEQNGENTLDLKRALMGDFTPQDAEESLLSALEGMDFTEAARVLQKAVEEGWLPEDFDAAQMLSGLLRALATGEKDVKQSASAIATSVTGPLDEAAGGAEASGEAAGSGYADGMLAKQGEVEAAAVRLAEAARHAFEKHLQIMSPSRVMREAGKMFDLGVAKGIDDETSSVVRSAVRMADTVAGAANLRPRMDLSGITKGMRGAISDIADIESARDIALYLNGREMARASTRDYDLALNGYARKLNLGYGRG